MASEMTNLWPPIETKVVSPIAILRFQASQLETLTHGLLMAEVLTVPSKGDGLDHEFRIIAPALDGYVFDLFKAWHKKTLVYPVTVSFAPWEEQEKNALIARSPALPRDLVAAHIPKKAVDREAATASELGSLLRDILNSTFTRGVIASLISRTNEFAAVDVPAEPTESTTGLPGDSAPVDPT
jgi:hypothetical protein